MNDDDRIDSCYCPYCEVVHSVLVDVERCLEARDLKLREHFTDAEIREIKGC